MINKTRGEERQPFAGLTPEVVLDAAAAFGLEPDGRRFALNSYENRGYQLGASERVLVLKFYRPARWRAPELDAPDARQLLGRSLARLHQIGASRPFLTRVRIGVERLGWEARAQVLESELLPDALRERYSSVSGALLERVGAAFAAAQGVSEIRIHGDCHLGNLLWNERGPVFVDLDDCATGVRVQDLWMMLSGSAE